MNHSIDDIIRQINQKWGYQIVHKGQPIEHKVSYLHTGFAGLDTILPGILKSHVSELAGHPTSGLTTLAHHIVAEAQANGENIVYLQTDMALDMRYAASCGVKMEKLLSVEAPTLDLALEVLREVVKSGVVGIVVVNLLSLKQHHLDLKRLFVEVRRSDCAVLLLLPSFVQSTFASLRLLIQRKKWLREDEHIVGCLSSVTIQKNRFGQTGQQALLLMPLVQEAWT